MNNDLNNEKSLKEICDEIFKDYKEHIDPNAKLHGSYFNDTYTK